MASPLTIDYKGYKISFGVHGWEADNSNFDSEDEAKGYIDLLVETDALIDAHMEEAEREGAEFYNLGWAQGDGFVHSKTDKGRLYTELNDNGKYSHTWEV